MSKLDQFNKSADFHIEKLRDIIRKMPDKGDTESESQKICLLNALNQFEFTVNGVEKSDFIA